jgi:hypothetical protein
VTQADLDRAAQQRDRALAAYQKALAAFDRDNPAPPCTWSTWREAKERDRRRTAALAPHVKRLDRARSRYRDLVCRRIVQREDLQP